MRLEGARRSEGRGAPPAQVEREGDASLVKVDHPDQFAISTAASFDDTPDLDVTGVVSPDISRNVPVFRWRRDALLRSMRASATK